MNSPFCLCTTALCDFHFDLAIFLFLVLYLLLLEQECSPNLTLPSITYTFVKVCRWNLCNLELTFISPTMGVNLISTYYANSRAIT